MALKSTHGLIQFLTSRCIKLLGAKDEQNADYTVLARDAAGNVLLATGPRAPRNGEPGWAKGCTLIDTDATPGDSCILVNVGTSDSCAFGLVTIVVAPA